MKMTDQNDNYDELFEEIYIDTLEELEFYKWSTKSLLREIFKLRKELRAKEAELESKREQKQDENIQE